MSKFGLLNTIIVYLRHITFIGFLYAGIMIYSSFKNERFGSICLTLFIIYSLVTLIMFFVKSRSEQGNFLNNLVVCILHFYMMLISYKYCTSIGLEIVNANFFPFTYLIASISMFVLIVNKFILLFSEK